MKIIALLLCLLLPVQQDPAFHYLAGVFPSDESYAWDSNSTYYKLSPKDPRIKPDLLFYRIGTLGTTFMTLTIGQYIKLNIATTKDKVSPLPDLGVRIITFTGYASITSLELRKALNMGQQANHKVKVTSFWDESRVCTAMILAFDDKYSKLCLFQSSIYAKSFWTN